MTFTSRSLVSAGTTTTATKHGEVVVIGGGQAGLAIGYFLAEHGRRFTILEAADAPAAASRARWDSLKLFTPVRTGRRAAFQRALLDHSFVELPVLDARGQVKHRRGVTELPGLYFLGLPWQHTRGSALLGWIKDDAEFIAQRIGAFARSHATASAPPSPLLTGPPAR